MEAFVAVETFQPEKQTETRSKLINFFWNLHMNA
jgi:hypothetical protein